MHDSYSMIFTVVNHGFSDIVMNAARSAGARGGTILNGRGTGSSEAERIFGFKVEPEKEIVLIVTANEVRQGIMREIHKAAGLTTEGRGFSFSIPIDDILGTMSLTQALMEQDDGVESPAPEPSEGDSE